MTIHVDPLWRGRSDDIADFGDEGVEQRIIGWIHRQRLRPLRSSGQEWFDHEKQNDDAGKQRDEINEEFDNHNPPAAGEVTEVHDGRPVVNGVIITPPRQSTQHDQVNQRQNQHRAGNQQQATMIKQPGFGTHDGSLEFVKNGVIGIDGSAHTVLLGFTGLCQELIPASTR